MRTSLINEINQLISSHTYFEADDFLISNGAKDNTYTLQITYRSESQYKFIAWIPNKKTKSDYDFVYKITAQAAPGEISATESFAYEGKSELFQGIGSWLTRVREELLAIPIYRQAAEQKQKLEEILVQFEELQDEYFSQAEAEELKKRLSELEERLAENIRNTVENQKEQKTKLDALESDMNSLKSKIDSHKKKGWVTSFAVRVLEWSKDPTNRKLLSSGAQVTKDLLLEAGKHIHNNQS